MVTSLDADTIDVSSTKQINTKSSAEAELIALSKKASQIIQHREFLVAKGYYVPLATVSTITVPSIHPTK